MKKFNGRTIVGILLILAGLLFISDNFYFIPIPLMHYLFHWTSILILIGLIIVLTSDNKGLGVILLSVGLFFTFSRVYGFSVSYVFSQYWPLILIALGLWVMIRGRINIDPSSGKGNSFDSDINVSDTDPNDTIDIVNIFGGGDKRILSQNFKGGSITSIFGGGDVDFRNAKLANRDVIIDLVTIFGGTDIVVPPDMKVSIQVTSIFGGFDDKRRRLDSQNLITDRALIIKGVILFGGGEIKN